ncbi:Lysine-specific histone demethylase 1A [Frankliniella fusca]|uniref:Lysine-specific histone demethylase 1A n=1 Tax=Frankliniella fusca TaxID=407009 RepID=A0AAE1I155_9NEOP|nr:Lysine-specific histone demethylase 1A [Frankliniella fusca]
MDLSSTRTLAALSSALCCSSLLCVVTLAVILSHWHDALDGCTLADCGCLLYARAATSSFAYTGSDVSLCWFSGAAPLPGLAVAVSLAAWYGYRGWVRPGPASGQRRAMQVVRGADGSGVRLMVQPRGPGAPPPSLPAAPHPHARRLVKSAALYTVLFSLMTVQGVLCLLLALFAVSHAAVLTDGFLVACREYRHAVLKTLRASGNLAELVNDRLTCPVIFDFLDYMKPDVREAFQGDNHWFPGQRKLTTVNTGAALVISLLAAYSNAALWGAMTVKFGRLAQQAARLSSATARARQSRTQLAMHCTDL